MANAITRLTIVHRDRTVPTSADRFDHDATEPELAARALSDFFQALASGHVAGDVYGAMDDGANVTRASGTVTITHASISDGDTLTIGGVVLTWRNAPATESEVLIGANATADAQNLVAKINAHSKLKGILVASSNLGVVTIQAVTPGRWGNLVTLATSDGAAMALSAATLAGASSTEKLASRLWEYG